MMNYSIETKSQLAKLLATENIKIEHRNAPTASFSLQSRTLICPIWKDMSGQMYDLLLGHEVSHALETPVEGWHDAVCSRGSSFKHFLNVVEDARIEKKIKRRYPGIRRSFIGAYKQLLEEDFFGIGDKDINKMFFIDRLNVYCKAGVATNIKFDNPEEQALLKLVEDAETWNDVLYATEQIWDYSKQEQKQESPNTQYQYVHDENGEYDLDDRPNDEDYQEFEENDFDDTQSMSGDESEEDSDEDNQEDSDSEKPTEIEKQEENDKENETEEADKGNDSDKNVDTYGDPKCETDEEFRKNENKLLSSEVKAYNYVTIPKLIDNKVITKAKDINAYMTKFFNEIELDTLPEYNEFKSKNEKYIGLLVKEFEMRKAASAYLRSKSSSTGDINVNKIYKYQLDDNIFRKINVVPKGKSHGLVLLLDMSGSMSKNIKGSVDQILVLTSFCKKVNIPFQVYGFTTGLNEINVNECFKQQENTLQFNNFSLIEFINSKMSTKEYTQAVKNMCGLGKAYDGNRYYIPKVLSLGRTPLVESVITLQPVINEFRKVNNLSIVNMVIVHDGDADNVSNFETPGFSKHRIFENSEHRYVFRDVENNLEFPIDKSGYNYSESVRKAIFEWFTRTTGTNIFGFFITGTSKCDISSSIFNLYVDPKTGKLDDVNKQYRQYNEVAEKYKKEKWLLSKTPGYESFFLIMGGKNLQIENEELEVVGKVTTNKLYTALRKLNKNKKVNRVLATKFIEGIAV